MDLMRVPPRQNEWGFVGVGAWRNASGAGSVYPHRLVRQQFAGWGCDPVRVLFHLL